MENIRKYLGWKQIPSENQFEWKKYEYQSKNIEFHFKFGEKKSSFSFDKLILYFLF